MSLRLEFHPSVEDGIDEAFIWYQRRRNGLGVNFLDEIQRTYQQIKLNPFRYAIVEGDVRAGQLKRFPFVVHYRVLEQSIRVLAIYHASRDSSGWKNRF